ncbi:HET-domain-containing protein [Ophiobolus disseminans]|uniref:HET-domain-containing protein n=1 Tax=Ophiobolus disseminans TaxID=1469910 RepID=A0A6A6ZKS9_9PLEO|nr:HET-domain-containing protein [Ophiobolus disseminans]
MPGELHCAPCERLLSGKAELNEESWFTHHPDADSFKAALELPCVLCSLAWNHEKSSPNWQDIISEGTTGHLATSDADKDVTDLYFHYDIFSTFIALVPWKNINHHGFPNLLSRNTRSKSALDFLLGQYQECRDRHVGCRLQASTVTIHPSRLINVGESGDSNICVRDTQGLSGQGLYTCLSHCWGQKQPLRLTKDTKSSLQNGVLVSSLPKTFQDAVFVTRLLGIRFLWIDSLCIFQDNRADWSTESSRMSDIYRGAACTIAATAAENSDGGLFFERDPTPLRPLRVETTWAPNPDVSNGEFTYPQAGEYMCDALEAWTYSVEEAPLNKRAWVCQERVLSPRIMHFSRTQLFWECHEVIASENYPSGLPLWALPSYRNSPTRLKRHLYQLGLRRADLSLENHKVCRDASNLDSQRLPDNELYFSWSAFRITYTKCAMTKEDDMLVAIQGIAQQFGHALGDQLVAGLWHSRLLEELCWFKLFAVKAPRPKWRAPSWSWASGTGTTWISNTLRFHRHCPTKEIWGDLVDVDVKANASGQIERAALRLRCKLLPATIEPDAIDPDEPLYNVYGTLTLRNSRTHIQAKRPGNFDLDINFDEAGMQHQGTRHVQMVIIQRCAHPHVDRFVDSEGNECDGADVRKRKVGLRDCVEGLLLVPRDGCDDHFERVGLFRIQDGEAVGKVLREYEGAESRVITLV